MNIENHNLPLSFLTPNDKQTWMKTLTNNIKACVILKKSKSAISLFGT